MLPPHGSQVWLLLHWYGASQNPPRAPSQQRSVLPPQATHRPFCATVFGAVQPMSPEQTGWPRRPQLVPQPPAVHMPPPMHIAPDATHWPLF
jgi:hypothetical protein